MNPSTARIFLYPNQHKLLLAKKEDRAYADTYLPYPSLPLW